MAFSKRNGLSKQFSTFADFSSGSFCWKEAPRLKRNMAEMLSEESSGGGEIAKANYWVAYWHQRWQSQSSTLPKAHLYAYLQEPCYWNAYDLYGRFKPANLEVKDCFQAAICRSEKILAKFNPSQGASLATYSSRSFGNAVRDVLERQASLNLCSDLSLLRRTSQKFLLESLQAAGLDSSMEPSYIASLQSFQAVFFPSRRTVRDLRDLSAEEWTAIAREYSQKKAGQPDLLRADVAQLQAWLQQCATYLRRYKGPAFVSLNNTCLENETEFVDQLVDDQADAMAMLEAQEAEQARQELWQQVTKVLLNAVEGLNESQLTLLQLRYGKELKQTEIAQRLNIEQSKVSRHLSKIRRSLLKDLICWLKENLHISSAPPVQKDMSLWVQEWLSSQFSGEGEEDVAA